jgi:hypothetical protein
VPELEFPPDSDPDERDPESVAGLAARAAALTLSMGSTILA